MIMIIIMIIIIIAMATVAATAADAAANAASKRVDGCARGHCALNRTQLRRLHRQCHVQDVKSKLEAVRPGLTEVWVGSTGDEVRSCLYLIAPAFAATMEQLSLTALQRARRNTA